MEERTRYFQIGFKKCGTTSLWAFFNRNGIPAVHFDWGRLGRRMQANQAQGLPLVAGYEAYHAFTNMEYSTPHDWFDGFRCWPELLETYPNSLFILNTRDRENWVRSMLPSDPNRRYWRMDYFEARWGTSEPAVLADIWKEDWDEHHRGVMAGIPRERLLVFDVEADSAERLCDFIGLPASAACHWNRENPRMHPWAAWAASRVPVPVKRRVPHWLARSVKRGLRRR